MKELCEKVTVLSLLVHAADQPPGLGVQEYVTDDVFICSLKVITIFAFNKTFVDPLAGFVDVISGPITSTVVNDQGFEIDPSGE